MERLLYKYYLEPREKDIVNANYATKTSNTCCNVNMMYKLFGKCVYDMNFINKIGIIGLNKKDKYDIKKYKDYFWYSGLKEIVVSYKIKTINGEIEHPLISMGYAKRKKEMMEKIKEHVKTKKKIELFRYYTNNILNEDMIYVLKKYK